MLSDRILVNDWHVVARSVDIQEGKIASARLLGEDLVLWRCKDEVRVWQDLCIHRGTRLSLGSVKDEKVICAYHGWAYDAEGRCVRIPAHPDQMPPAKARVRTYQAKERYGLVWVCLGEPEHHIPSFAEWDDPSYVKTLTGPYRYRASGPRVIENFLDVAHLPFVHAGILGDPNHPEIQDYEPVVDENGITASDLRICEPNPHGGMGEPATVTYTYRVLRPLTAYFVKRSGENNLAILYPVTPVTDVESVSWMSIAVNFPLGQSEEIGSFEDKVASQDVPVVESQRPELLPLDLQAELHLRSDRTAIAYRQWLKHLGVTFGTK